MKESGERSNSGYQSVAAVTIHSGILKSFEGNFHQGIKIYIIYFSLTDINIRIVIILVSIHWLSIHTSKNSSGEPL